MCLFRSNYIIILFVFLISCQEDEYNLDLEDLETESFLLSVPDYFPFYEDDIYNPLTKNGVMLGEKLFNDQVLSKNNKVSCATCHLTKFSFSDGEALSSLGVTGNPLKRTAPTLVNLLWMNNGLFWDGGSKNLESQAIGPLTDHDEMGQNLHFLIDELNKKPPYQDLFEEAFNDTITVSNVLKALAQYQRSLISANSKYDKIRKNEPNVSFTVEEQKGYDLFKVNCASCHVEPLFTDNYFHNNGIDSVFDDDSFDNLYKGRYRVTNDLKDIGKYKTPTLRNVLQSAPYMHDGRYANITDVLDHYCCNIKDSETLDSSLKKGLNLTDDDNKHIIHFLNTLTDYEFLEY